MAGKKIIVLAPGSENCRIGLIDGEQLWNHEAEFTKPHSVLHVLARKLKTPQPKPLPKLLDEKELQLIDTMINETRKIIGVTTNQKKKKGVIKARTEKETRMDTSKEDDILIGQDALKKLHDESYEVIWPIKEGRLRINEGERSMSAIKEDLTCLWSKMIEQKLQIKRADLSSYKVMLLVADQFLKRHVKLMVEVLLTELAFSAAMIHQESVCAAFAAGLQTACVIDIGHEKTAISCIDDGISINRSRVYYNFGGKDVQNLLCHLICNSIHFQLDDGAGEKLMPEQLHDQTSITTIKNSLCHLDFEDSTQKYYDLVLSNPKQGGFSIYPLTLNEELILAPMGLFNPAMFAPVPQDYYIENNADYHEYDDCLNGAAYIAMGGTLGRYAEKGPKDKISNKEIDSYTRLPIDEAIIASVRQVGKPDLYKKLLGNIVLAGGSTMFPYFPKVLEEMVSGRVKAIPELAECHVEVLTFPRDCDPCDLGYKGAGIVASAPVRSISNSIFRLTMVVKTNIIEDTAGLLGYKRRMGFMWRE